MHCTTIFQMRRGRWLLITEEDPPGQYRWPSKSCLHAQIDDPSQATWATLLTPIMLTKPNGVPPPLP